MSYIPDIQIWPGSGSFQPGLTPFGYFDNDPEFSGSADKMAAWCAHRLGYPIMDVELQDINFYAAFEEAVIAYNNLVNEYDARDQLLALSGLPTGSINLATKYIKPTLQGIFKLSHQYGTPVGAGGTMTYYTGSINLQPGVQTYDLDNSNFIEVEKGDFNNDEFTIRRIFHMQDALSTKYTGYSTNTFALNHFGWSGYNGMYMLMPLNYDLQHWQALELNEQIRKSSYSFQLVANRIKIFPIPKYKKKLHFHYTLDSEATDFGDNDEEGDGKITNISNIPYHIIMYSYINDIGKNWIRRYTLAICKEVLGLIRGKYDTIVVPDNEISLNAQDLLSQAQSEMDNLLNELRETLELMTRQSQLERHSAEADAIENQMRRIPLKIYVR